MAMSKVVLWSEHVRRWRSSGLTRAAYCAEHAVKAATLSYWACRLGKAQRAVCAQAPVTQAFVPVHVAPAATVPVMIEVSYSAGLRLSLPVGVDVLWAAALVRALGC